MSQSHSNGQSLGQTTGCSKLFCSSYRIPNPSCWGGKCNFFPLETKVEQAVAKVFAVGSETSRLTGRRNLSLASACKAGWREGEGVTSQLGRSVKMCRKGNQGLCEPCTSKLSRHKLISFVSSKARFSAGFLSSMLLQHAHPNK